MFRGPLSFGSMNLVRLKGFASKDSDHHGGETNGFLSYHSHLSAVLDILSNTARPERVFDE